MRPLTIWIFVRPVLLLTATTLFVGGMTAPALAAEICTFERGISVCINHNEEVASVEVVERDLGCVETITRTSFTTTVLARRGAAHGSGKILNDARFAGSDGYSTLECQPVGFDYLTDDNSNAALPAGIWGALFYARGFAPVAQLTVNLMQHYADGTTEQMGRSDELRDRDVAQQDGYYGYGQTGFPCSVVAVTFTATDGTTTRTVTVPAGGHPNC